MPQSYATALLHIVFSTKLRFKWLRPQDADTLKAYAFGILRNLGCRVLALEILADHVHVLVDIGRCNSIADVVRRLKMGTHHWLRRRSSFYSGFGWQRGYAAFSVSPSAKTRVIRYINNQPTHHEMHLFEDEYLLMLQNAELVNHKSLIKDVFGS